MALHFSRLLPWIVVNAILAGTAGAQSVILGLGYSDYSLTTAKDAVMAEIEYHHTPFAQRGPLSIAAGGVVSADSQNDYFIGLGLVNNFALSDPWFVELSLMPGFYLEGPSANDLGHMLEFRSVLALGVHVTDTATLSIAAQHKSNAGIDTRNPGVNALVLRYHRSF